MGGAERQGHSRWPALSAAGRRGLQVADSDIDLALDILPFGAISKAAKHLIERCFLIGREFKSGQEVERLT